jgi:hypothetical protein
MRIDGIGVYHIEQGKLIPGEAEKRHSVDYSNWHAGNVSPEDLKKHKELLDRQYFMGPFWEGKPKPKSIMDFENPLQDAYADA